MPDASFQSITEGCLSLVYGVYKLQIYRRDIFNFSITKKIWTNFTNISDLFQFVNSLKNNRNYSLASKRNRLNCEQESENKYRKLLNEISHIRVNVQGIGTNSV